MATRVKKKSISEVTLEQATEASQQFANTFNGLAKIQAKMNDEISKVRGKYQDKITELQEALEEPHEILEVFAKEQKENWGKKKSHDLLHCTIGFRTGTPKVCKGKKFTWDAVLELVKKHKTLSKLFVRTKDELNKEAIIATKDEKVLKLLEEDAFIFVDQEECFYVEAKQEELVS